MAQGIQRRFVRVTGRFGTRQVHYRAGGSGPALLLLHQSPQSSRELAPLMEQWGADSRCWRRTRRATACNGVMVSTPAERRNLPMAPPGRHLHLLPDGPEAQALQSWLAAKD